jgi:hypothetical protein
MTLNSANRTINGTLQTASGVTLSNSTLTINGTAQINAGGFFANSPVYGNASLLKYNTGGVFGRGAEWVAGIGVVGSTAGYPNDVQVSNSTTLNVPNTGSAAFSSLMGVARDLIIDAGSSFYMDYGGNGNKSSVLSVYRNITINGIFSLSNVAGGDMNLFGNWTRTGVFITNSRAVNFIGSTNQTITGATTFDYLILNNASGVSLQASSDITVNYNLNLPNGRIATGASKVIIPSTGVITRGNGWIQGKLQKNFNSGVAVSRTFEIGNTSSYLPVVIAANVDVAGTLLVATTDGEVYAWGYNGNGLGNGSGYQSPRSTPVRVSFPTGVRIVEVSGSCSEAGKSLQLYWNLVSENSPTWTLVKKDILCDLQYFKVQSPAFPGLQFKVREYPSLNYSQPFKLPNGKLK